MYTSGRIVSVRVNTFACTVHVVLEDTTRGWTRRRRSRRRGNIPFKRLKCCLSLPSYSDRHACCFAATLKHHKEGENPEFVTQLLLKHCPLLSMFVLRLAGVYFIALIPEEAHNRRTKLTQDTHGSYDAYACVYSKYVTGLKLIILYISSTCFYN